MNLRDGLWPLVNIRRGVRLAHDIRAITGELRKPARWLPTGTRGTLQWFGNAWALIRLSNGDAVSVPRDAIAPS